MTYRPGRDKKCHIDWAVFNYKKALINIIPSVDIDQISATREQNCKARFYESIWEI
jgi:hypothetical protein